MLQYFTAAVSARTGYLPRTVSLSVSASSAFPNSSKLRLLAEFTPTSERGTIMILMALLLVVVLAGLGMGVDVTLMNAAKEQQVVDTRRIALSALQGYFAGDNLTREARVEAARVRANEVAKALLGNNLAKGSFEDLAMYQDQISWADATNPNRIGQNGRLLPGKWWETEPAPNCAGYCLTNSCAAGSCPCPAGSWSKPCFQTVKGSDAINAMKVEYRTAPDNALQTSILKMLGTEQVSLSAYSIATLAPRRIVFIVDLSRSLADDSHGSIDTSGLGNDAFVLEANPRFLSTQSPPDALTNCQSGRQPYGDAVVGSGPDLYWSQESYTLPAAPVSSGPATAAMVAPSDPTTVLLLDDHDRFLRMTDPASPASTLLSNYRCIQYTNVGDHSVANSAGWNLSAADLLTRYDMNGIIPEEQQRWNNPTYLVDMSYWIDPVTYANRRPEPLFSVLKGISTAMREMEIRSVKGDEIGIVFSDDGVLPKRASLVEDFDGAAGDSFTIGMVKPGSAEFTRLLTEIDNFLANGPQGGTHIPFLPRYLGQHVDMSEIYPDRRSAAGTDLAMSWRIAAELIHSGKERPDTRQLDRLNNVDWGANVGALSAATMLGEAQNAQNMVVLFSDGWNNCTPNTAAGLGLLPQHCLTYEEPVGGYKYHYRYVEDYGQGIARLMRDFYVPRKVPVHIMLTGSSAIPHTVPRHRGNIAADASAKGCMSGADYQSLPAGHPMYDPNSLHRRSFMTGWSPHRSGTGTCSGSNGESTTSIGLSGALDISYPNSYANYSWATGGQWLPLRPPCYTGWIGDWVRANQWLQKIQDNWCTNATGFQVEPYLYYITGGGMINSPFGYGATIWGWGGGDPTSKPLVKIPYGSCGDPQVLRNWSVWAGRQLCDLDCRSKEEQVQASMDKIMGDNPYRLVDYR